LAMERSSGRMNLERR